MNRNFIHPDDGTKLSSLDYSDPIDQIDSSNRIELIVLYVSTFLLRTGFGAGILLFDWLLVWPLESRHHKSNMGR